MISDFRYSAHPDDVQLYATEKLRKEFLIEKLFVADQISVVYSLGDRFIVGGVLPKLGQLKLETYEPLKSEFFLERREIGIINVGNTGKVIADGEEYTLDHKDALYLGRGTKEVVFESVNENAPSKFYFNSSLAHKSYPSVLIKKEKAAQTTMGSSENSNLRNIHKLIIHGLVDTCQLQMGLTELLEGSVWNTMPPHTHNRRSEVYFYFDVAEDKSVCHFMGKPQETRHLWVRNDQAVISPAWSIHAGVGTSSYSFIWGMAGENHDYSDMDMVSISELK